MKKLSSVGVGLAGLAASAYFLLSPKGKKYQKELKSWVIKMKGEVVEKLEKAKDVSEPVYHEIIDTVAARHKKIMKNNDEEIAELAQDLKKHWRTINASAKTTKTDIIKDSKKIVKKIAQGKNDLVLNKAKVVAKK